MIVDFGGVLIGLDRQRCADKFRALGLEGMEQNLDLYHQQGFLHDYERGVMTSAEFREAVRSRLPGRQVSDADIDDAWNSILGTIPSYKLDLLLRLRKDYVVYLLSNTNEIHWEWSCQHAFPYKTFRVEDYFEEIFLSFRMQLAKPDVRIFEQVIAETGIDPVQTLFIDDSVANCLAAGSLGITTYTPAADEDWSHLFE